MNEDGWTAQSDIGQEIVESPLGWRPHVVELTQDGDGWSVTRLLPREEATISC